MENEASFGLLLDIIGDVNIQIIGRDMARDLRDTLCMLPANIYKLFPDMTISQVLEVMETTFPPKVLPMSLTSVNKHLSRFSSLMSFCIKEGKMMLNQLKGYH